MTSAFTAPDFSIAPSPTEPADVLVLGLYSSDDGPVLAAGVPFLTDGVDQSILRGLTLVGATGKVGQVTRIPADGASVTSVLAVGLGPAPSTSGATPGSLPSAETVRRAAGVAARALDGTESAVTTLSALDLGATVEGFVLGAYRFTEFRSARSAPKKAPIRRVELLTAVPADTARAIVDVALHTAQAVTAARDFVNTPPNALYPAEFAERAKAVGDAAGLTVEVFDEQYLAANGYGGIVGVGQGSSRPPRLVRLSYSSGIEGAKKVALVGKGITFDTGGISIKPAANMDQMTSDMGGAAAVIATAVLAARLQVGVDVTATVPIAENMPSGTAQRPGDVLTQYGGITVEVLNTDAEGRLILADAIVRACQDDPDYLIDTATLTGAQMVALGTRTPGVMGTEAFRDRVAAVSRSVGENGWAMPFPEELRADIDSRVADLANVGPSRWGGMLLAGVYLQQFVADGVAWAHIDVAGPAFNTGGPWGYTPKGGTGVPVRTMIAVIQDIAANG